MAADTIGATEADTRESASTGEGKSGGEQATGTPLPRAFVAEGSGPVTVVREHGDVTERTAGDLSISRRLTTLEAFGAFWALRNRARWKAEAIAALLDGQEDDVRYAIDDDQLDEWDVRVDGHVQAFFGVAETIVAFGTSDGDGEFDSLDAPTQEFYDRVARNVHADVDDLVEDFARDLMPSPLWGVGARLVNLAVTHGRREDLDDHVEALREEVRE